MSIRIPFLILLLLAFPSTNGQIFNGVPFSRLPEFIAFLIVLPFVWSPLLRRVARRVLWRRHSRTGALTFAVAAAALLGKVALLSSGLSDGFQACYQSAIADKPSNGCERSYEHPLERFRFTRIDSVIDFRPGAAPAIVDDLIYF